MIAPMSYGALSKSTKIALAKASALSDICDNSGEGGLIPEVREAAKRVVVQCLGGRLGWNVHAMRQADGVEIYISQGAKPGLGGLLPAAKVTPEIARILSWQDRESFSPTYGCFDRTYWCWKFSAI
jgi:glutamate synthase domain-containing protein 2